MNINFKIQKLRPYPTKLSIKKEIAFSFCVLILGIVMGLIAKMTDSISIIGQIGTEIGIWIFVATIIAAYSRYPLSAAVNVILFFLAMLFTYYIYGHIVLGFFPKEYFVGWLIIALISPFAGFITWFSKARGLVSSIITAIPAALLFTHGYPAFYTLKLTLFLSLLMGCILCFILPSTARNKVIAIGLAIILAFIFEKLYIFSFLPF